MAKGAIILGREAGPRHEFRRLHLARLDRWTSHGSNDERK